MILFLEDAGSDLAVPADLQVPLALLDVPRVAGAELAKSVSLFGRRRRDEDLAKIELDALRFALAPRSLLATREREASGKILTFKASAKLYRTRQNLQVPRK